MSQGSLTSLPARGESRYPTESSQALDGALSETRSSVRCSAKEITVGDRLLLPKSDPQGKQKSFENLDQQLQVEAEWGVLEGLEYVINAQVIYELVRDGVEYSFLGQNGLLGVARVRDKLRSGGYDDGPLLETAKKTSKQLNSVPLRGALLEQRARKRGELLRQFPFPMYLAIPTRAEALRIVRSSDSYAAKFDQPFLPLITDLIQTRTEDLDLKKIGVRWIEPHKPFFLEGDARKRPLEQEELEAAEPLRKAPRVD